MRRLGRVRLLSLVAMLGAVALGAGCGGDQEPAIGGVAQPGSSGTLVWALPSRPSQLDPLLAERRADQLVTRQIHEPLVAILSGPFGDPRRPAGRAGVGVIRASPDNTLWRVRLRGGIRFQDGARLDAAAVLANAHRWLSLPEGRALLPDLENVDAPRPDRVRFFLSRPDDDFSRDLSSPRLGLVSPRALRPSSGEGARMTRVERTGTGPFELRERSADRVLVARNVDWWGTPKELGPALDQVEFRAVSGAADRYTMLRSGEVQVADDLGPRELRRIRGEPLLTALDRGGAPAVGLERSVRGIDEAGQIPSLSGVWLTRIGAG